MRRQGLRVISRPAEAEANYYRQLADQAAIMALLKPTGVHGTRGDSLLALGHCAADLQAVQSILAYGGYIGQPFAHAVEELLGAEVKNAKRSELHTFAVMP